LPFPILFLYEDWVGNPVWVLNFHNNIGSQKSGQLLSNDPALLIVKVSYAMLDRPRTGFYVEGVLGNFLGDTWHFCRAH
jgi:hypothetical protein